VTYKPLCRSSMTPFRYNPTKHQLHIDEVGLTPYSCPWQLLLE
jgi:hypothetical protein